MGTYSSGEDLVAKTRKPYTITKQRDRWTEEEHNRFLEALKLYGRAWQRIEEHIGTKTAVQIRSHAQKFFTKLEKEALVKGVPVTQALDIDIPPPRPKRKPINPYPRKTGLGTPGSQFGAKEQKGLSVSSFSTHKQVVDLEKEPFPEKPGGGGRPGNVNDTPNENGCSEVLNHFQGAPRTSLSSANRNSTPTPMAPRNSCAFRECVPLGKVGCLTETYKSHITVGPNGNLKMDKHEFKQTVQDYGMGNKLHLERSDTLLENLFQSEKSDEPNQPEPCGELSPNDMQETHNYPRHVPVHVLNASLEMNPDSVPLDVAYQESVLNKIGGVRHGQPNLFSDAAAAYANTQHVDASRSPPFPPPYPLFDPFRCNQDNYQAYLQSSSAFSSLIVSTLLQNPATHAAASFAASFWPFANMEASANAPVGHTALGSGAVFHPLSLNPSPGMAAIVAATVAAATAWWAAHGLLPFCSTTLHNGFHCNPDASAVVNPTTVSENINVADKRENEVSVKVIVADKKENEFPLQNQQQLDTGCSEVLQAQKSVLKLHALSSSDSDQSEGAKCIMGVSATTNYVEATATAVADSIKTKSMKLVDRSSCGSNTSSSSEVETDVLEKHASEKAEEELKKEQPCDVSHPACDSNNRRCGRSSSCTSDSWKEVSEEGRLAFQALFSREVLPQSFSPPNDLRKQDERIEDALELDLNSKMWGNCCSGNQVTMGNCTSLRSESNGKVFLRTVEIGQGKLKARRTGFKPYKRCSIEAKESMVGSASCSQGEEKGPKRIRLDEEASI